MAAIWQSQKFENRILGLLEVLNQSNATAAFPFLFERNQPTSLTKPDQDMDVFRHDDEAETKALVFCSDFLQKVDDDSLASILVEQLTATIAPKRDEVSGLRIIDDSATLT